MTSATAQRCHIPPYSRKNGANATPAPTRSFNVPNFIVTVANEYSYQLNRINEV